MRGSRIVVRITMAAVALALVYGAALAEERLVSGSGADAVTPRDVQTGPDGSVTGVLVNNTSRVIRDVRLMIHHTWFWKTEMKPGDDNPGRVEYYTVSGTTIDPHGNVTFRYKPSPPLAVDRTDGHFETSASVVGYTEIGR